MVRFLQILILLHFNFSTFALPEFQFFETHEEAANFYYEKYEKTAGFGANKIPRKPISQEEGEDLYLKANKLFKKVYNAFEARYSTVRHIKRLPILLILNSSNLYAGAPRQIGLSKKPYLFIIDRGLLKKPEAQILGVFAHELSHLYFHGKSSSGKLLYKDIYYKAKDHDENFYFTNEVKSSDQLQNDFDQWLFYSYQIGPSSQSYYGDFPYDSRLITEGFLNILSYYVQSGDCSEEKKKQYFTEYGDLHVSVNSLKEEFTGLSKSSNEVYPNDFLEFKSRLSSFQKLIEDCSLSEKASYDEVISKSTELSDEVIKSFKMHMNPERLKIYQEIDKEFQSSGVISGIWNLTVKFRERMKILESKFQIRKVRVLNEEDHADEIAVQVLYDMDISINGYVNYLKRDKECKENDLTYRRFDEEWGHLSDCWRIKRLTVLTERLKNETTLTSGALPKPKWSSFLDKLKSKIIID